MLGIRTLQIGPQEFFYITKGFSHLSLLDLLQDPDVRNASNLLFPINSNEADQVELDEVEPTRIRTKSQVEKVKSMVDEVDFENLPYFHGAITRDDAVAKLQGKPQGTFLTRFV